MSDQIKYKLRNLYSELEVIIINEISMVSNNTLLNVHKRSCEVFGCSEVNPFASKTVLKVKSTTIKSATSFCSINFIIWGYM